MLPVIERTKDEQVRSMESDRAEDHASAVWHSMTSHTALEDARRHGPLARWEELMAADPLASFCQGPSWCMSWYRAYLDRFQPFVLFGTSGDCLIGLVPLAVERSTGRVCFAGDNLCEYRDIVALHEYRMSVVAELLNRYYSDGFPNPLHVGPTQPDSNTGSLIRSIGNSSSRPWSIVQAYPCWRVWFRPGIDVEKFPRREFVRRHINYYKRQGAVSLERVTNLDQWSAKEDFFEHHSLRQLQAARPPSFDNACKRAFYESLFREDPESTHVTSLLVGSRWIAGHYGHIWKGVLYWGAPSFDIREEKRSPGQILLALLVQDAHQLGLRGVDLGLGPEEFKQRFGTDCALLPFATVHPHRRQYVAVRTVAAVKGLVRSAIVGVRGQRDWDRLIDWLRKTADEVSITTTFGWRPLLRELRLRILSALLEKTRLRLFAAMSRDLRAASPAIGPGEGAVFRINDLRDLLKWRGTSEPTARRIQRAVQAAPERLRHGWTLQTLLLDDRLRAWAWSLDADEGGSTGKSVFTVQPRSLVVEGMSTTPQVSSDDACRWLLTHIVQWTMRQDAICVYVVDDSRNSLPRGCLEQMGFRVVATHEVTRLLWRERSRTVTASPDGPAPMASTGKACAAGDVCPDGGKSGT